MLTTTATRAIIREVFGTAVIRIWTNKYSKKGVRRVKVLVRGSIDGKEFEQRVLELGERTNESVAAYPFIVDPRRASPLAQDSVHHAKCPLCGQPDTRDRSVTSVVVSASYTEQEDA
jgi:hypothetical protein